MQTPVAERFHAVEERQNVLVQERTRALAAPRASLYAKHLKRAIDFVAALVLLPCCLPPMLLAALLIVLESKGSPLYRQRRVGGGGKTFTVYKLRTMVVDSEHVHFKTEEGDVRVTAIGAFLRDTKIDELPQLWNVLCGEMSLIGPRPLSVAETEHLIDADGFDSRTPGLIPSVRPGLTGLEQCTRSSFDPYEHRFALNDQYQSGVSMWLDLWIIRKTVPVCPLVCALSLVSLVLMTKTLLLLF